MERSFGLDYANVPLASGAKVKREGVGCLSNHGSSDEYGEILGLLGLLSNLGRLGKAFVRKQIVGEYAQDSGRRKGDEDSDDASETDAHGRHHEDVEGREVERLAHEPGNQDVVLELLDDEVEREHGDDGFGAHAKREGEGGQERENGAEVRYELGHSSDEGQCETGFEPNSKNPFEQVESEEREGENGKAQEHLAPDPGRKDGDDGRFLRAEVGRRLLSDDAVEELADGVALEHEEEREDEHEHDVRHSRAEGRESPYPFGSDGR